jgi:hypothetical protein
MGWSARRALAGAHNAQRDNRADSQADDRIAQGEHRHPERNQVALLGPVALRDEIALYRIVADVECHRRMGQTATSIAVFGRSSLRTTRAARKRLRPAARDHRRHGPACGEAH